MRTGILVDASCDAPSGYTRAQGIEVMPTNIRNGAESFTDTHDAAVRQRYLRLGAAAAGQAAVLEPASPETIQTLLLEDLVNRYDRIFCLTPAATTNPVHAHASHARTAVLQNYRQARAANGQTGAFLLRVIDTQTRSAGCAVVAAEALRLIREDASAAAMRERLELVSGNTYAWIVVRDPQTWRAHAQSRNQAKVGKVGAAMNFKPIVRTWRGQTATIAKIHRFETAAETLFGNVANRVQAGLMVSTVVICYGGMLAELEAMRGYAAMARTCKEHGVELLGGPMSVASMATFGMGALAVGFACPEYEENF